MALMETCQTISRRTLLQQFKSAGLLLSAGSLISLDERNIEIPEVIHPPKDVSRQRGFGHLANHFKFVSFKKEGTEFRGIPESWDADNSQFNYALVLTEGGDPFIDFWLSTAPFPNHQAAFESYLEQLPSLSFSNVSYLFELVCNYDDHGISANPFQIPENYPSEFARCILSDTYGRVVYRHQVETLVMSCSGKPSWFDLEYCGKKRSMISNQINRKVAEFCHELEKMTLPDGCPLWQLLTGYSFNICFTNPDPLSTFAFMKRAKKYLT